MSRAIRTLLHMASNGNVQSLWDDISFHYAQISYPHIHEIENLMRKLITKFMLTNVGLGWAKDTVPEDVKKKTRAEKGDFNNNYLYEVDFIQLSEFLFSEYRTLELSSLIKKISEIKGETVNVSEISEFIPKSNWKRYFEPHVDCDAAYLESRWKKLYELRCKIAHNNSYSKSDFEQVNKLSQEVKEKLEKAIESLDAISVPEDERDELLESVIGHSSQNAAAFLSHWRELENASRKYTAEKNLLKKYSWKKYPDAEQLFVALLDDDAIDKDTYSKIRKIRGYKEDIIHGGMISRFFDNLMPVYSKEMNKVVESLNSKLEGNSETTPPNNCANSTDSTEPHESGD